LYDGTTLSGSDVSYIAHAIGNLPLPTPAIVAFQNFASRLALHDPGSLPYLHDKTHLMFSILLCVASTPAVHTIKRFNLIVIELLEDGIPMCESDEVVGLYNNLRSKALQLRYIMFAALLGILASILFLSMYISPNYVFWWGNRQNGIAGLFFGIIIGVMVFLSVWVAILLAFGSLMLAELARLPLSLRPFHKDGCNGLAPIGIQIFWLWAVTSVVAFAIYIVLRWGYFGIERNPVVWLLAALFSLVVMPAIAVPPLYAARQNIKKEQAILLHKFGSNLNRHLHAATLALKGEDFNEATKAFSQYQHIKDIFDTINSTNVWPFHPRFATIAVISYLTQVALFVRQIIDLMAV